ncbi:MAG: alkylphosphonate utilization protein [Magnetococcales bacterium]|nr:alkylphosphonate utilization protein [Magnetococcales bacterium]
MSTPLPPCPQCESIYAYEEGELLVCPECGHEWNRLIATSPRDTLVVKDAYGTPLQDGDSVTLIKDLKIKGSSSVAKVGTKVKINRLVEGDHNIDCKIGGIGAIMLKSELVKKA